MIAREFFRTNGKSVVIYYRDGALLGFDLFEVGAEATEAAQVFTTEQKSSVAYAHCQNGYAWVYVNGKAQKV